VLRPGVLGSRYRHGGGGLREVVEAAERLAQVEDDRAVVRGVDRRQAELIRIWVGVGAGVAAQVEDGVGVGRAVGGGGFVQGSLDGVFDVLAGDGGAVLECDAGAQGVGPGLGVVAGAAQGLGEVGDEGGALLAGGGGEHHQRAPVIAGEVPAVGVVGV